MVAGGKDFDTVEFTVGAVVEGNIRADAHGVVNPMSFQGNVEGIGFRVVGDFHEFTSRWEKKVYTVITTMRSDSSTKIGTTSLAV